MHPQGALLRLPFFTTDSKEKFLDISYLNFHSWSPDIVDEPVFTDILVIIEFAGIVLPLNEIQLEFVVNGGIPIIIIDPVCDNVFDCI